jgi:hypothetical protein
MIDLKFKNKDKVVHVFGKMPVSVYDIKGFDLLDVSIDGKPSKFNDYKKEILSEFRRRYSASIVSCENIHDIKYYWTSIGSPSSFLTEELNLSNSEFLKFFYTKKDDYSEKLKESVSVYFNSCPEDFFFLYEKKINTKSIKKLEELLPGEEFSNLVTSIISDLSNDERNLISLFKKGQNLVDFVKTYALYYPEVRKAIKTAAVGSSLFKVRLEVELFHIVKKWIRRGWFVDEVVVPFDSVEELKEAVALMWDAGIDRSLLSSTGHAEITLNFMKNETPDLPVGIPLTEYIDNAYFWYSEGEERCIPEEELLDNYGEEIRHLSLEYLEKLSSMSQSCVPCFCISLHEGDDIIIPEDEKKYYPPSPLVHVIHDIEDRYVLEHLSSGDFNESLIEKLLAPYIGESFTGKFDSNGELSLSGNYEFPIVMALEALLIGSRGWGYCDEVLNLKNSTFTYVYKGLIPS